MHHTAFDWPIFADMMSSHGRLSHDRMGLAFRLAPGSGISQHCRDPEGTVAELPGDIFRN
jgi:hypothetical protein